MKTPERSIGKMAGRIAGILGPDLHSIWLYGSVVQHYADVLERELYTGR